MYERVGNSVILVCKKAQKDHSLLKGLTDAFSWSLQVDVSYFCILHFSYGCEKARENTFWFDVCSYIESVHLQQLKRKQSSEQGTEKGHHLSIEGIRNIVGTFFCQK